MAARLRPVLGLICIAALALVCAGPASAASPQKIYRDLADNGRLERVVRTDAEQPVPGRVPAAAKAKPEAAKQDRMIPFTGLDLALLTIGGGPLLLIGIGLRRRLAAAPGTAGAVRG
jgi:hypothetical protein